MNSKQETVWRVISLFAFFCFALVIVYFYYINIGAVFFIPSLITFGFLIYQIIKPANFYLFGLTFCMWGLIIIFNNGSLFGYFLYTVGNGFFYKCGFFASHKSLKMLISSILLGIYSLSILRFGVAQLITTALEVIGFVFGIIVLFHLFDEDFHIIDYFTKTPDTLLLKKLTPMEQNCADLLAKGKTYNQIAESLGCSESTVKRIVPKIYDKFKVKNKQEFVEKYIQTKAIQGALS